MAIIFGVVPGRSQKPGTPCGYPMWVSSSATFSGSLAGRIGLEVEQRGFMQAPIWHAGAADNGLTCCTTALALLEGEACNIFFSEIRYECESVELKMLWSNWIG